MIKQTLKVSEVKNNPNNPRLIKDDKFTKLVQSIKDFPEMLEAREIVVNKDHVILGGNMRFKAAVEAGLKEVPVKVVDWPEDKQREFIIKDNVSGGEWDWDLIANEWDAEELDAWGLDIPFTEEVEVEEDEAPEVDESEPPKSKLGEIYQLGRHRVMCGDSTDYSAVEKLMDGEKVDLVFTDPPYGVDYDGGHAEKGKRRDKLINDDEVDMYDLPLKNAFAFSKNDSALYLWFADRFSVDVIKGVVGAGYQIRNWIIWNKNVAQFGAIGAQYKSKHEPLIYAFKKGQTVNWSGPNNEVTVWDVSRDHKNDHHPTQKPVELCIRAMGNHTTTTVLDLFLGSGATLIGAEQTDRTCYGMELDPKYVDVIRKRYHKFVTGDIEGWEEGTPCVA